MYHSSTFVKRRSNGLYVTNQTKYVKFVSDILMHCTNLSLLDTTNYFTTSLNCPLPVAASFLGLFQGPVYRSPLNLCVGP